MQTPKCGTPNEHHAHHHANHNSERHAYHTSDAYQWCIPVVHTNAIPMQPHAIPCALIPTLFAPPAPRATRGAGSGSAKLDHHILQLARKYVAYQISLPKSRFPNLASRPFQICVTMECCASVPSLQSPQRICHQSATNLYGSVVSGLHRNSLHLGCIGAPTIFLTLISSRMYGNHCLRLHCRISTRIQILWHSSLFAAVAHPILRSFGV